MSYSYNEFKDSNINYLNKDFSSLKSTLMEYAKTYFPNSYRDFNETSPGMMLIEMSAYVGDVLSFYIDQQYKEMMLPLAEERRNVVNIAKMLGYRTKPILPAYVTLTVKQTVSSTGTSPAEPSFSERVTIDKGWKIKSSTNSDIIFETIDEIDFRVTGSVDPVQSSFDSTSHLVTQWELERSVNAISGETKTKRVLIGAPQKFLEVKLSETNIIEVLSVSDSNGNKWYEVDYLAQDKVPISRFYASDAQRNDIDGTPTAYTNLSGDALAPIDVAVPYSLRYIRTDKKYIIETNDDDTTSLIFGNGLLRNGQTMGSDFFDSEQVGITIPGTSDNLTDFIDPSAGDKFSTLGETPAHVTLTIKYRVGGGLSSNVNESDLTSFDTAGIPYAYGTGATLSVTNNGPARGGSEQESIEEIRNRAKAFFATQNRCVTKEDYEARVLNMPARFGKIAKVYVDRSSPAVTFGAIEEQFNIIAGDDSLISIDELQGFLSLQDVSENLATISIYTLCYNMNKELVRLSNSDATPPVPHLLHSNLKNYLSNYRILTDEIQLFPGYIINFGVVFSVVAHRHANKQEVKYRCIQKVIDFFNIDRAQFKQAIYVSELEYELMGLEGVRAVNYITLTQQKDYNNSDILIFDNPLYLYSYDNDNSAWMPTGGTAGYGWKYDFEGAFEQGTIRASINPSVFELKNPQRNVKGIVY